MTTVSKLKHHEWVRKGDLLCALTLLCCCLAAGTVAATENGTRWHEIKASLFGDRSIQNGENIFALDTPYRAEDAAVVPITIHSKFGQTPDNYIKDLYLVIDNNPSPVAAVFHFTGKHNWESLSTRVRVNAYTDLRLLAETSDGNLYMVNNFVKASGGCSAPSLKDPAAAAAQLGKMKFRLAEEPTLEGLLQTQLLIKHPNNSGLQFDQISRQYIPADFIRSIEVTYRGEVVFTVDADISISEDPSIRFGFVPGDDGELKVKIQDSNGRTFTHTQALPTQSKG